MSLRPVGITAHPSILAFTSRSVFAMTAIWLLCGAVAHAQTDPGTRAGFEVHGRLYSGSAPAGFPPGDGWAQGQAFQGVLDDDGNAAGAFNAKRQVDPNWGSGGDGVDPTTFAGSSNKNDDLIGLGQEPWDWGPGGGGPRKNDLTNTYFHTRVDGATDDHWAFIAAETRSTNGDSHVDFEFNQAGISQVGDAAGQLVGNGPSGGRSIGDFVVSIDFLGGGSTPTSTVRIWNGSAYVEMAPPDGAVVSAANLQDIAHGAAGTWKHFDTNGAPVEVLSALQFVEAGINLTAMGINIQACNTAATFTVKTRSSSSFTSELKDFALVHFSLQQPPVAMASNSGPVCEGSDVQLFAQPDGYSYSWTGPGEFASDEQNPIVPAALPGEYCVTVGAEEGCSDTACTEVALNLGPDCFIFGPDFVCAQASCITFSGPEGMAPAQAPPSARRIAFGSSPPVRYNWEIEGDGIIVGLMDGEEVVVDPIVELSAGDGGRMAAGDSGVLGEFTLFLTTTAENDCESMCSLTVQIIDCPDSEDLVTCEGCSQGYWKQPQHFDEWPAPYTPGDLFAETTAGDVTFEDAFSGKTLLDVLQTGGGDLEGLGRQTVAALLNGASGLNFPFPAESVITLFNDTFPGSEADYASLADEFEASNLAGCVLGAPPSGGQSSGPPNNADQ